ncbi:hypothetical protein EN794_053425 [Mesorhizobium sp. M00.F.Ca.ET.151.01.1.1]|nr:hypothetical protein EN850_03115 [Mesorhizobium sp. M8A.F.Ca.ET.207.01.1.1]TGU86346.1 hypothetical protein EN794_053425 [Mesorhizobium sp. M00.F.Ca.ET.151.01.1.1]
MEIETLGDAWNHGVKLTARCIWGNREDLKTIRECNNRYELAVYSMLWTRGRDFPLSRLSQRLLCPKCGSRLVAVGISMPSNSSTAAARIAR